MCNGLDCTQTKKHWKSLYLKEKPMFSAVGMTGLEPATSRPPDVLLFIVTYWLLEYYLL